MKYLKTLLSSGLFSELDDDEQRMAYEEMNISARHFDKGEIVFLEGDIVGNLCIIHQGLVKAEKIYPDGDTYIAEIFEKGSIFAGEVTVSKKQYAAINYVAAEDSEIIYIPYSMILDSPYSARLGRALSYVLSDYAIRQAHRIEILAERSIRERVMAYLGILSRKAGGDVVTVNMSREELARYLCVNRSALSNELSKMKKEGILDWKGKQYTLL